MRYQALVRGGIIVKLWARLRIVYGYLDLLDIEVLALDEALVRKIHLHPKLSSASRCILSQRKRVKYLRRRTHGWEFAAALWLCSKTSELGPYDPPARHA